MPGLDPGTVALAVGAGLLAAVNPCGFALLPAYLSLFVLDDSDDSHPAALARALKATLALTAGFAGVFLLFGLAIAPVAASVQQWLPGFTIGFGLAVAGAGAWVLAGHSLPALPVPRARRRNARSRPLTASWPAMTGFGASYAVASLGCTIAPFLAVVVTAFRAGSPGAGVVLFLGYALGMGLVVGAAAVAIALARGSLIAGLRRSGGVVARVGGGVLLLAGAYVAWYGFWELRVLHAGAGRDPVVEAAATVQRWLATRTEALGWAGFVAVLAVLAALAVVPRLRHRRSTRAAGPPSSDHREKENR
jgi:cytochrome c-type biogenesis protein